MRIAALITTAVVCVAAPLSAAGKFVASDVRGAAIAKPGKIVISNDKKAITVVQHDGDLKKTLLRLKSVQRRYNASAFNSNVSVGVEVPRELALVIEEASRAHGIDPRLVTAVARRESHFKPAAVSRVGASGVMQLMPATARYLGVTDIFDVRQNVYGGTKYLRMLLDTFSGDIDLTLAAYNAGPGAVEKYRGIPPYRETQAYVRAIRADYDAQR